MTFQRGGTKKLMNGIVKDSIRSYKRLIKFTSQKVLDCWKIELLRDSRKKWNQKPVTSILALVNQCSYKG